MSLYLLNEQRIPYPVSDFHEWAKGLGTVKHRRVAWTPLRGGGFVSTVFLGIDHRFGDEGDPILFETMVFYSGWQEGFTRRYSFWPEAVQGHTEVVQEARKFLADIRASVLLATSPLIASRNRREGRYPERLKKRKEKATP